MGVNTVEFVPETERWVVNVFYDRREMLAHDLVHYGWFVFIYNCIALRVLDARDKIRKVFHFG